MGSIAKMQNEELKLNLNLGKILTMDTMELDMKSDKKEDTIRDSEVFSQIDWDNPRFSYRFKLLYSLRTKIGRLFFQMKTS